MDELRAFGRGFFLTLFAALALIGCDGVYVVTTDGGPAPDALPLAAKCGEPGLPCCASESCPVGQAYCDLDSHTCKHWNKGGGASE